MQLWQQQKISWTEEKTNLEVLRAAGVQCTLMKRSGSLISLDKARHRGTSGN